MLGDMARTPTRLPSGLNEEDPFLIISDFSLSLRKMLTLTFGALIWWLAASALGLVLGGLLSWLLTAWLMVLAGVLTFVSRGGRPLEEWLVDKILFQIQPTRYTLRDPNAESGSGARVIDASFDDEDEWHGV